jgi:hypothetical protein
MNHHPPALFETLDSMHASQEVGAHGVDSARFNFQRLSSTLAIS